jgi:hypothetical protein
VLDERSTWTGVSGYAGHYFVENREPATTEVAGEVWFDRALKWRVQVN